MGNIISLDDKLGLSEKHKRQMAKRRKYLALQRVFQCARCAAKCEKCGVQISEAHLRRLQSEDTPKLPYRFCEGCMEEYVDYIGYLQGIENPDCYWYNAAWVEGWGLWIQYQGAMDRYLKSSEFKRLVREVQTDGSDA